MIMSKSEISVPAALASHTRSLVVRFAEALAEKLLASQIKFGHDDNWHHPGWMDKCRADLVRHIKKGDPRDVAAYCAFLWHHKQPTFVVAERNCNSEECGWRGSASETVQMKHGDPNMLCPKCYETTEAEAPINHVAEPRKMDASGEQCGCRIGYAQFNAAGDLERVTIHYGDNRVAYAVLSSVAPASSKPYQWRDTGPLETADPS